MDANDDTDTLSMHLEHLSMSTKDKKTGVIVASELSDNIASIFEGVDELYCESL